MAKLKVLERIVVVATLSVCLAVGGIVVAPQTVTPSAEAAKTCFLFWCKEPSPAGCEGKTHYVHNSTLVKYPWTISVHGSTSCKRDATSLKTYTALYMQRWWGWQLKKDDTKTASYARATKDAAPHWYCKGESGARNYLGQTQHTSVENGKTYTATTTQRATLTCKEKG